MTSAGPPSPRAWSAARRNGGLRRSGARSAPTAARAPPDRRHPGDNRTHRRGSRTRRPWTPGLALPGSMAAILAETLRERDLPSRPAAGTSGVGGGAFLRRLVPEPAAALDDGRGARKIAE